MEKEKFMKMALKEAKKCEKFDDVPVGAVIVKDGKVISKAYNQKEKCKNAVKHAEILAIEKASKKLNSWHLGDLEIYVTKQPCLMCYGALLSCRIKAIYFGAFDKKYGMQVNLYESLNEKGFNHKAIVEGGILEEECAKILTEFFKNKRK